MTNHCPNYKDCNLVSRKMDMTDREYKYYADTYCCCKKGSWSECMRFRAKKEINFCPDFVFPDSVMTIDEIIDRFDNENIE